MAYRIAGTAQDPSQSIYVAYNGWIAPITATLPPTGAHWWTTLDTDASALTFGNFHPADQETVIGGATAIVSARSVLLLTEG